MLKQVAKAEGIRGGAGTIAAQLSLKQRERVLEVLLSRVSSRVSEVRFGSQSLDLDSEAQSQAASGDCAVPHTTPFEQRLRVERFPVGVKFDSGSDFLLARNSLGCVYEPPFGRVLCDRPE